jgi:hypothetical protein
MQTAELAQRLTQTERELTELLTIRHTHRLTREHARTIQKQIARAEQRRARCRAELQSIAARSYQSFADVVTAYQAKER